MKRAGRRCGVTLLALSLSLACEQPARPPPPIPAMPERLSRTEAPIEPEPTTRKAPARSEARPRAQAKRDAPRKAAERRPDAREATTKARSAPPPAALPEPTPAPARSKAVATRVTIPSTPHVGAEVPSGLQAALDADPRMQPWLERVIAIADGCHARDRGARGTIEAVITMHESARPDADVRSLPTALSGVAACATGALLRMKMPLFTDREGARYTVRLHFQ